MSLHQQSKTTVVLDIKRLSYFFLWRSYFPLILSHLIDFQFIAFTVELSLPTAEIKTNKPIIILISA